MIGYSRADADEDRARQQEALRRLGVLPACAHLDTGIGRGTGSRPGLQAALAECRLGDTLVVTGLERLARSLPDLRDITAGLRARSIRLNIDGITHNPATVGGAVFFDTIAQVVDMETALARHRTRAAKPNLPPRRGEKNRQLSDGREEDELITLYQSGEPTIAELAFRFKLSRSAVYRIIERHTRNQRH
jgi:DNA invertase Pin-like site-specific DNA recombinase